MLSEKNTTVIICCAGMGTRLGIGTTKALLLLNGKPLIIHLLEQLDNYDDIRIVVGFQAEKIIDRVNEYRGDIMYVFNYDYENTGPAASASKALLGAREYTVILDGDLIIQPDDFKTFLSFPEECVGYSKRGSSEPIYVDVREGRVNSFSKSNTAFEWTGIMKAKTAELVEHNEYVYEMINPLLPMKGLFLRAKDIDTVEDYENAEMWLRNNFEDMELSGGE